MKRMNEKDKLGKLTSSCCVKYVYLKNIKQTGTGNIISKESLPLITLPGL